MKRFFDICFSLFLLILLFVPMVLIGIIVKLNSKGPALFWSQRVGQNNKLFLMPKFRSMNQNTVHLATHLIKDPDSLVTSFGRLIRRFSLDELPQLFSVLRGDMSFVGPRPALFNQNDLINLRTERGIEKLLPGITGWAQVNGRDDLTIEDKVVFDFEYLVKHSFWLDLKILWLTALKVILVHGISH